jgi:Skp family chaperone for outer membrane proteins
MNKVLIGVNAALVLAVAFLFYKVNSLDGSAESTESKEVAEVKSKDSVIPEKKIESTGVATPPTGKIAFINIDVINEESEEVKDLVEEAKRSKAGIEGTLERLSQEHAQKMQEYEASAKAGIAPPNVMQEKEKAIIAIEKEAQNKQIQADNLAMKINEKNFAFQQNLKNFLVKWNDGRYDYILSYSESVPTMLLGNASLDVTREVIKMVNEEYMAKKSTAKKK